MDDGEIIEKLEKCLRLIDRGVFPGIGKERDNLVDEVLHTLGKPHRQFRFARTCGFCGENIPAK